MRKGCQLYIIEFVSDEKGPSLNQYLVLVEFSDVFPKELPGLPPERELDFTIDIKPSSKPTSTAPYRMMATELWELKNAAEGTIGPTIHNSKYFTVGCTNNICKEEGWFLASLHRLQKFEQSHSEK